jgi:hypothetical protein
MALSSCAHATCTTPPQSDPALGHARHHMIISMYVSHVVRPRKLRGANAGRTDDSSQAMRTACRVVAVETGGAGEGGSSPHGAEARVAADPTGAAGDHAIAKT